MAIAAPAVPLIIEGIKDALIILGVLSGGAVVADQVDKANKRAKEGLSDAAPATVCQTCRSGPCATLAGGVPGAKYQGGAHGLMKLPPGDGLDSHHMPSADASYLPREIGPAIKMDPADHLRTASHGSSRAAAAYRLAQKRLIDAGNFTGAFAMDVADIRSKLGNKYDGAIAQAGAYMQCLKQNGIVR